MGPHLRPLFSGEGTAVEELWQGIEADGPLSAEDALAIPPPPGVDFDSWQERLLTQADRRRSFIARWGWSVPARPALRAIVDFIEGRELLEVCAGSGLWSRLLRDAGVCVSASDPGEGMNQHFVQVEALDAEQGVLSNPGVGALMFCWPPMRSDCAFRALRAFGGDRLIYVGDTRFTGDAQLQALLAGDWELAERLPLPTWPGLDDALHLYRRRTGLNKS